MGIPIGLAHRELGCPLGLPTDKWVSHKRNGKSYETCPQGAGMPTGLPINAWVSHERVGKSHWGPIREVGIPQWACQ